MAAYGALGHDRTIRFQTPERLRVVALASHVESGSHERRNPLGGAFGTNTTRFICTHAYYRLVEPSVVTSPLPLAVMSECTIMARRQCHSRAHHAFVRHSVSFERLTCVTIDAGSLGGYAVVTSAGMGVGGQDRSIALGLGSRSASARSGHTLGGVRVWGPHSWALIDLHAALAPRVPAAELVQ